MASRFRLVLLLMVAVMLPACSTTQTVVTEAPADTTPVVSLERPFPNDIPVPGPFLRAVEAGTRTLEGRPGEASWTQESSYQIRARIHPEERLITGEANIRYRNNSPDALDRLYLELAQNLHAEGVVRNVPSEVTGGVELQRVVVNGTELQEGGGRGARYVVDGTQLAVIPGLPLASGAEAELEISWQFVVPQAGASARMGYDADNLFFVAYWYPIMSVYDDVEGWHLAPFRGQTEFYGGYADYDVVIEAPGEWLVMATGDLENAEEVLAPDVLARMREAHQSDEPMEVVGPDAFGAAATSGSESDWLSWRFAAQRVRDFAFSATRESIWEAARTPVGDRDGDGEMDYAAINTFYREAAPLWADVTEFQQHAIAFLSSYSGYPYPWPHMTAVEGANIIGGGMEFPMMTLMGDYNARGSEALYNVTAHELAHMWVPMIVSNNERRYTWFDEGMTTFHENEARGDFYPGRNHHLEDQVMYLGIARSDVEMPMMLPSDFHDNSLAYVVASYMKPSTVLVALREIIGEEVFNRTWQTFIQDWAYGHPYPHDLFHAFEREAGMDLNWFWRTWYYETWTLDQAIASVEREGSLTRIHVRDEGDAPMPVLLRLTLEDGSTLDRRIPVDVWLRGARDASIEVETASPVVQVEIDADLRFPDIDRANNIWDR